jgi:serine/threonine protein kinase
MNDLSNSLFEERVNEVIAAYLEADRAGEPPDHEELLAQHPDLADELRAFFADRACLAQLVGPVAKPVNGQTGSSNQPAASLSTVGVCRYVGLDPHARGGLGEVFTATDTELHRVVALKRLQDRCAGDASSQRRFLVEAEITARLEHPGVVPVHSLFHDEGGRPCYAMRFIEGQNLESALLAYHAGKPDPVAFRRLLQSFITVCETVAYAHSRGVIHRDLKPKNIMLGKFGETIVVDWGLAKVVGRTSEEGVADVEGTLRPVGDSSGEETQMGVAVGTVVYMSPEQAAGRWDVINAASDVYGLGAVLYAILTGRARWDGGNWPEIQQKIQRGEFPRPRMVRSEVPRALEAICLKAMAVEPADRYPSAVALAAEVERWLADEPVQAYREPINERLWRWARRRKNLLAIGVSVSVALVSLGMGTWIALLYRDLAVAADNRVRNALPRDNFQSIARLQNQQSELHESIVATLDGMVTQADQDPRYQGPEFQPFRNDLLKKAIRFWDQAIQHDADSRGQHSYLTHYYRVERALCLARLGEHEQAAAEAKNLWATSKEPPVKTAYHLSRIYALCALAARDDRELADQYADQAMDLLRRADDEGYFEKANAANAKALAEERDLASLASRPDFRKLLQEVKAKHR